MTSLKCNHSRIPYRIKGLHSLQQIMQFVAVKIENVQLIATHCISCWFQQNRYNVNEP